MGNLNHKYFDKGHYSQSIAPRYFIGCSKRKKIGRYFQLKINLESKILNATAEVESAKLMRQTADILSGKAAMQIRYLEAIKGIASQANVKVVFLAQ